MVGRNNPCPCGSGKKYKECCLNKSAFIEVKPSNQPEVIDSHLVSYDNGKTWEKRPGLLAVRLHVVDPVGVDSQIDGIFKEIFDCLKDNEYQSLREKFYDCKHKLYAVRHYKTSIETEIKKRVEEFEKEYQAASGAQVERENHKLIYDTESFLFQVKSNLDLLTQALGLIFPELNSFRTFSHSGEKNNFIAGGKVIKALQRNNQQLADLFEEKRVLWIQDLVFMRNTITHYSQLKGFHCFIEEPYLGKDKIKIHYPTMPTGERVDAYCLEIYNHLCELYRSVFKIIK